MCFSLGFDVLCARASVAKEGMSGMDDGGEQPGEGPSWGFRRRLLYFFSTVAPVNKEGPGSVRMSFNEGYLTSN